MLTSLGRLPRFGRPESSRCSSKPVKASQLYNALLQALAEQFQEPAIDEPDVGKRLRPRCGSSWPRTTP